MQSSNSGNFKGKHLFGELYNVSKIKLSDSALLTNILLEAIPLGNATICGIQVKSFEPTGVTILALLAESHASIHTYPECQSLFLDIFTCGNCQPENIFDHIVKTLGTTTYTVTQVERGETRGNP